MTKDPFRKQSKVFVLITVTQIHISKWEAVIVCRSRTPRGMTRRTVTILPQVIRFHFGEWEAGAVWVYRRFGGVQIFHLVLIVHQAIPNILALRLMGCRTSVTRSVRRRSQVPGKERSYWLISYQINNVLLKGNIIYSNLWRAERIIYLVLLTKSLSATCMIRWVMGVTPQRPWQRTSRYSYQIDIPRHFQLNPLLESG